MANDRLEGGQGGQGAQDQLRRLQERWLALPLSYRVNALLYALGAGALLYLAFTLFSGDDQPSQIQVGAGVTPSSSTTRGGPTSAAGATAGAGAGGSTTTGGPTTSGPAPTAPASQSTGRPSGQTITFSGGNFGTTVPAGGGAGGGGDGGGGGSGGGGGGGGGGDPTTIPTTPQPTATTSPPTTTLQCRNSTDSRCGTFRWEPMPTNQPLAIEMAVSSNPKVGQDVTFTVTVSDSDHGIGTCARLDFGDGTSQGDCPEPPCPNRYGPWDPPAPGIPGTRIFTFTHQYTNAGPFIATVVVDDRTDCWDPFGERKPKNIPVVLESA